MAKKLTDILLQNVVSYKMVNGLSHHLIFRQQPKPSKNMIGKQNVIDNTISRHQYANGRNLLNKLLKCSGGKKLLEI
jgi:hypothetical protein